MMDDNQQDRKIDIFMLCNAAYLSRYQNEAADPTTDLDLIAAMKTFADCGLSSDDCRKYLIDKKGYCDLLAQASVLVSSQLPHEGLSIGFRSIVDPREMVLSGDFRFKELDMLANLSQFLLEAEGGELKNPLSQDDFLILKEKVISSYVKLVSFKRKFAELVGKIKRSASTKDNKKDEYSSDGHLVEHQEQEHQIITDQSIVDEITKDSMLSPRSESALDARSPLQTAGLTKKIKNILAIHARFTWAAQMGLFLGRVQYFLRCKVRNRSRSKSKPGNRGRSSDR